VMVIGISAHFKNFNYLQTAIITKIKKRY